VGGGLVPIEPLSRRYRDLLGTVNAIVAGPADNVHLMVAGRALTLHPLATDE
jgi:adenosyl cobinamide kinase/adenosyl cobinamide phosphate guanylyltransferase